MAQCLVNGISTRRIPWKCQRERQDFIGFLPAMWVLVEDWVFSWVLIVCTAVLMDKGIIIGVEYEAAIRSNLPFVLFRHATSVILFPPLTNPQHWCSLSKSHLFLQHILLHHLENDQVAGAVSFASYYKNLVFFAHSLEILLHTVVESDFVVANNEVESTDKSVAILPTVADFLDHFDTSLDVVVGCARKTELTRWPHLFNVVGTPKSLFEVNIHSRFY